MVLAMAQGSLLAACMQDREAAQQLLEGERGAAAANQALWAAERQQLQAALKAALQAQDTVRARLAGLSCSG
jgi:hypothetical protein